MFCFFSILRTSSYIYSGDLISVLIILISIGSFIINRDRNFLNKYANQYRYWLLFTSILWAIQTLHSTIAYYRYGQTFMQVLSTSYTVLTYLSFFPLAYYQEKIANKDYLKNTIINFSLIAALLSILQVVAYNVGVIFLDIGTLSDSSFRNGTLRLGIGSNIVAFAFFIVLFEAVNNRKGRTKNILYSIIFFLYFTYAAKTRSLSLYIIISVYLVVLLWLRNRNTKFLLSLFGIAILVYLIFSGTISYFVADVSTDVGVNMRFNTIKFYWQEFTEHPILGMGYIKGSTASPSLLTLLMGPLWYGTTRYYYRDDVGFIGLLNEDGIIGAIWYITALMIIFKQSVYLYKVNSKKYVWCITICIFITLCSINLIYTNPERFPAFIMIMTLINHYYIKEKNFDRYCYTNVTKKTEKL